uniref:Uncharacterized protein n=1 Tax=viral metagenome TaxID=1070528 RepID=A0A6C0JCD4_9ZZZZ
MLDFVKETRHNYLLACESIIQKGGVELACINCVSISRVTRIVNLKHVDHDNLICNMCELDVIIPITNQSHLTTKCYTRDERIIQIQQWHDEGFTDTRLDDDDDYEDYEYDSCGEIHINGDCNYLSDNDDEYVFDDYSGEEMKESY